MDILDPTNPIGILNPVSPISPLNPINQPQEVNTQTTCPIIQTISSDDHIDNYQALILFLACISVGLVVVAVMFLSHVFKKLFRKKDSTRND